MKGNGKVIMWATVVTIVVIFVIKKVGSSNNVPVVSTLARNI